MKRATALLFVTLALVVGTIPAAAETDTGFVEADFGAGWEYPAAKLSGAEGSPTGSVSISSHLIDAMVLSQEGADSAAIHRQLPLATFAASDVEVELRFDSFTETTISAVRAAGLAITGSYPEVGWLTGHIDPADIGALDSIVGLRTVHPKYGFTTATGSVENQADVSMRTDQARALSGVDGSGVEIGILSDSFDGAGVGVTVGNNCNRSVSGTASQNSGDLPENVGVLVDLSMGTDEGRGMAELISDLAPGSDLTFRTAGLGEADFAQGIRDLADCGADVIVDDVLYFAEPMFQDGPVAQAAGDVAAGGVPYFSSAGNQGGFGVNDTYVDINPGSDAFGDNFHNFGGGDVFARVRLDPGEGVRIVAQWNDPFDGSLGPGAISDFDIGIFDTADLNVLLAASATSQGCAFGPGIQMGDPLEIVQYTNFGITTDDVFVIVDRFCTDPGGGDHLRLATFGLGTSVTGLGFETDIFTDMQQYGHAVAKKARSVAAVFYGEIDDPAVDPPSGTTNVEAFSSLGGDIPIYFDGNGDPLSGGPQTRFKPEIAAADGTNTSFFGSDIGFDPDGDPNFFGTSAAAPHAAAVAALLLESEPGISRAHVYDAMEMTAVDIESNGKDALSGYGLVDGLNALSTCNGLPATIVGTAGDDDLVGTGGDDVIVTFGGNDVVDGKGGNDTICLGVGDDTGRGGSGKDTIFGGPGADELRGQKGGDTLDGGTGKDVLIGGSGGDVIIGGSGGDTVDAGSGSDEILGQGGNDVIEAGDGNDTVEGGGGSDDIRGGDGEDTLKGNGKADTIRGGADDDTLSGGGGGDTLLGGSGFDTVKGGKGTDTCIGETQSSCEL